MQFSVTAATSTIIHLALIAISVRLVESTTEVLRPRGVPLSKKVFYDASRREFNCLDGSTSVPFFYVNDDYCDCEDGSDEPGTSACPNGVFHCSNIGHFESVIPSSRVNDGICDCCDASDEYNSSANCVNNCMKLGEAAREEMRRHQELMSKGYETRQRYATEAKQKKDESLRQIEDLKKQKDVAEAVKNEKESLKRTAEDKEKAAVDKFKAIEEVERQKREEKEIERAQEEDKKSAERVFGELDLNKDNLLEFSELQTLKAFDKDGDGTVSEDEAKFFLHAKNDMDLEEFVSTGWVIMKPYYTKYKESLNPPPVSDTDIPHPVDPHEHTASDPLDPDNLPEHEHEDIMDPSEPPNNDDDAHDSHDPHQPPDDEEEDEEDTPPYFPPKDDYTSSTPSDVSAPEYDEETKKLIEAAKQAKQEFSDAEGRFLDIQNKIREHEVYLETDYGEDDQFLPLHGQCFDYTDREYTYQLCLFDKTTQRSKDGGSETNLGRWGKWVGPEHSKYDRMRYDGGSTCWNGPARSVVVNMKCGLENEVTAASEPSRCEYEFDFNTPAMCSISGHRDSEGQPIHEEL